MSLPSNSEIEAEIRSILQNADLSSLSSKVVRKSLEEKFHVDLSSRKQDIDGILMTIVNESQHENDDESKGDGTDSGSSSGDEAPENADSDFEAEQKRKKPSPASKPSKPPTKKPKITRKSSESASNSGTEELDDEKLARRLQEEESGRPSRAAKKPLVEKKRKKASASAASSENGESSTGKKRRGGSIYSKECVLSEDLATVVGTDRMARKDVVKRMWEIFRERNLIDPKQRQYVICEGNPELERLFKTKRFKAFGMMKILKHHIKDAELVSS